MNGRLLTLLLFTQVAIWRPPSALAVPPEVPIQYAGAVDPMRYPPGLCPGNPLTRPVLLPPLQRLEPRHVPLALQASAVVYTLSDLDRTLSGRAFVKQAQQFLAQIPSGYRFDFSYAAAESGLKFMILKPIATDQPWILSIAGTQSTLDWMADLDLGRAQLQQLEKSIRIFTNCSFMDEQGQPLASHPFLITGHSLGGGLAQVVAYLIQERRIQAKLSPMHLEVVTFNGFGGQELVEKAEPYRSIYSGWLSALNYYVKGDVVSRIGTHIGPMMELLPPGESDDQSGHLSLHEIQRRHSITLIEQIYASGGFAQALKRAPTRLPLQNLYKTGGVISRFLVHVTSGNRESNSYQILTDAVQILRHNSDRRLLIFVRNSLLSEILDLKLENPGLVRDTEIRNLQALEHQLERRLWPRDQKK